MEILRLQKSYKIYYRIGGSNCIVGTNSEPVFCETSVGFEHREGNMCLHFPERWVRSLRLCFRPQCPASITVKWDNYLVLVDPNAIILLTSRNYKLGMRPKLRGARTAFKAGTQKNTIPAREKILREGVSLSSVDAVLWFDKRRNYACTLWRQLTFGLASLITWLISWSVTTSWNR